MKFNSSLCLLLGIMTTTPANIAAQDLVKVIGYKIHFFNPNGPPKDKNGKLISCDQDMLNVAYQIYPTYLKEQVEDSELTWDQTFYVDDTRKKEVGATTTDSSWLSDAVGFNDNVSPAGADDSDAWYNNIPNRQLRERRQLQASSATGFSIKLDKDKPFELSYEVPQGQIVLSGVTYQINTGNGEITDISFRQAVRTQTAFDCLKYLMAMQRAVIPVEYEVPKTPNDDP